MRRSVGFDLDMTLVDSRPGIRNALVALAADTGRPIDVEAIVAALGPPIGSVLPPWFSAEELPGAVQGFREHMAEVGVVAVAPMRGAASALSAVRDAGLDVIVVTSKITPLALATLAHAGLAADHVFGDLWAEAKASPLREHRSVCFVGDHPGDIAAALAAGMPAFGVLSGASTRDELAAAGAACVAGSLEEFPIWLESLVGSTAI